MFVKVMICLLLGYVFGCFQSGYFYGRFFREGMDVRNYGSGNAGSTNVVRTMGKKAGYIVFFSDAFKTIFAVWIVRYLLFSGADHRLILEILTGFGAVLGHNYPFYMNFKGGKGIAVTGGFMFAMDVRMALAAIIIFGIVFYTTRYVSVGSLVIMALFPVMMWIKFPEQNAAVALSVIFTVMAWWRHRANINRLIHGTENKFEKKKK